VWHPEKEEVLRFILLNIFLSFSELSSLCRDDLLVA